MKKGITVHTEYDRRGRWVLVIEKRRGKLTLDEIKDTAREYEWDYYLLVLDCYHKEYDDQFVDTPVGDRVELYRTDDFWSENEP